MSLGGPSIQLRTDGRTPDMTALGTAPRAQQSPALRLVVVLPRPSGGYDGPRGIREQLPWVRGKAGVDGVRFGPGCNDAMTRTATSREQPSRASARPNDIRERRITCTNFDAFVKD